MFLSHHQTKIQRTKIEKEKTLRRFPVKINIKVDLFMQYVHTHSLEITEMLKSGYTNDQQNDLDEAQIS